jgi:trk system potassium uptake protein TrkA
VVKKPLAELNFPKGAVVGSIIRGATVIIPRGDTQVQAGDRVVVFALPKAVEAVEKMFS